ncbi:MAG: PQQ-binding-like beta-propeller repeat protein, partial [Acidimicrobiales bacterium]
MASLAAQRFLPRLVVTTAVLLATTAGVVASAADWPEFRADVTNSGVNPAENAIGPSTVGSLAPVWAAPTGDQVSSSPAVANGTVYVGSDDTRLYAMNAATGQILWSTITGGSVRSSPAVANGTVYVGSDDTRLYAMNAATG